MPTLSPEAWAQIRCDYEHTDRPVEDICVEHGISSGTLRDRMRRWNWTRRRSAIPREGPPAVAPIESAHPPLEREGRRALNDVKCEPGWGDFQAQTHHPTPTVFAGAQTVDPPPPGEGERAAEASADPAAIVPRLQSAVARVLPAIAATLHRLAAGPQRPREMEQTARTLATLMRTLRELNAALAQQPPQGRDGDDEPIDIDAFRFELARRINAFVADRRAEKGESESDEDTEFEA